MHSCWGALSIAVVVAACCRVVVVGPPTTHTRAGATRTKDLAGKDDDTAAVMLRSNPHAALPNSVTYVGRQSADWRDIHAVRCRIVHRLPVPAAMRVSN